MPDTCHYITSECPETSRLEAYMNPPFTQEKSPVEGAFSCPRLCDCSTTSPCGSLLLHRIPSASLYSEEMLVLGASRSSPRPTRVSRYSREDTERSSIATLIDFGEWVSGQYHERPPSLLPPAPHLSRLPPSDAGRVECRLPSSTTPLGEHETDATSGRSADREQLPGLSTRLQAVSFSSVSISSPPTRPITPVPSLTASDHSHSSFGTESSPCTIISLPKQQSLSSRWDSSRGHMGITTAKRFDAAIYGPCTHNISSPSLSPPPHHERGIDRANLSVDPSQLSPSRPAPILNLNNTAVHLPQTSRHSEEVSYIEWDEEADRLGNSAFGRIKKSFIDLRAAERYITEARTRSRMQASSTAHARATSAGGPKLSDTGNRFNLSPAVSSAQGGSYTHTPAKLRKKASTLNLLTSARASNINSSTPPSTGKRKRTNTMSSQRSQDTQKKKAENGIVGKFVRGLIGAGKELSRD